MPDVMTSIAETVIDAAPFEEFVLTPQNGALVTFRGIVRDHDHGESVSALDYQAHPDAARFLEEACALVAAETGLRIAAVHRVGALTIGDTALVAAAAAPHRAEAFAACERVVEIIKQTVPIWKRQHLTAGVTEWVGL
ncbi:molybdenum cofactor biosynthesis protein MoaE [Conyzicola nivalis]|uniref:Molybdenum cofactor biosynthesis protein MoaE n=1 Tax=Conyzicola nivalis TaxID=1477021 RepID=A0A916SIH5_9MICO|nr:molybdenum cofactor biosynthesis protein MoaE [Conyzicola nivalis]GGB02496.1 molybdenum cofactor biosynthesis protein MoaE [Conyzicola nivalis]